MSRREVCWGLFLVGLPFAHFLWASKAINQWYAQTFWAEGWIAMLFGLAVCRGGMPKDTNRPLGCWFIWLCLSVIIIWLGYLQRNWGHPIGLLSPLIHASCVVLFYVAAMTDWTGAFLQRLARWIAVAGSVLVAYGILQLANFDQFYKWIDNTQAMAGRDSLLGTIGNPAYFGMHLAFLIPVFLWCGASWGVGMAVAASVIAVLTLSSTALLCVWLAWAWWGWYELPRRWWWGGFLLSLSAILGYVATHHFWLNPSGRLDAWQAFWQRYMVGDGKQQITGAGLGRLMGDSAQNFPDWPKIGSTMFRHAHCEYFQVLIEQGVIGFAIVLWGLWDAGRHWWVCPRTPVTKMLGGIGLLVLVAALINNSAHYWVLGSFGLLAYCGVYVLAREAHGDSHS